MEKHTCKFCFKKFPNGRALGGHMRSHVALAASARPPLLPHPPQDSSSSSFGPDEDDHLGVEDEGEGGPRSYGLRENPKRSFRMVDPEFAAADYSSSSLLAAAAGNGLHGGGGGGSSGNNNNHNNNNNAASSAVVLDRESETESSKQPSPSASVRRRSKRRRRHNSPMPPPPPADPSEPEPVSSVSDTTPDEDVAFCLMMLSRDIWSKAKIQDHHHAKEDDDDDEEVEEEQKVEVAAVRPRKSGKSRYQCGTCKKVFKSYQALGGHRASHKKIRPCGGGEEAVATAAVGFGDEQDQERIRDVESELNGGDQKIHECPFCFRVFSSGQALGGHKRSHLTASASTASAATTSNAVVSNRAAIHSSPPPPLPAAAAANGGWSKFVDGFIDLNLPAPSEEEEEAIEEGSFVELSAVSDA